MQQGTLGLRQGGKFLVLGGAGDLGRNRILPALHGLGLRADVVDPKPFPGDWPEAVSACFASLEQVNPSGDYLGAIVASPNHLHLEHCRWVLGAARVPCLCEKPIAHTLEAARRMTELATSSPPLWIADHYLAKSLSAYLLAGGGELLRAVGPLQEVHGRILELPDTWSGRAWLRDPASSGGGVWVDTGIHLVTLLLSWPRGGRLAEPAEPAGPAAPAGAAEAAALLTDRSWQVHSAVATGYDVAQGLAETYFCLSAAAGPVDITLQVGKTAAEPRKDLLLVGRGGRELRLDWHARLITLDGEVARCGAAEPYGGYLRMLRSFAAACAGAGPEPGRGPTLGSGLVSCDLAERALRLVKSAYAYAGLPPALQSACLR